MASKQIACGEGSFYEGQVSNNGNPHGKGLFSIKNEKFYVIANNGAISTLDGKRIISFKDTGIQIGKCFEGQVTIYYNNNKYNAEYKDGKLSGDYRDGDFYTTIDTDEYKGTLKNGLYHGCGKTKNYEGDFINGKYEGNGKLTIDNDVYEGQFFNGKYHGKGTLNGVNYSWINGKRDGYVITNHENYVVRTNYIKDQIASEIYNINNGNEIVHITYENGNVKQYKMINLNGEIETRIVGSNVSNIITNGEIKVGKYENPIESFTFSLETYAKLKEIKPIYVVPDVEKST